MTNPSMRKKPKEIIIECESMPHYIAVGALRRSMEMVEKATGQEHIIIYKWLIGSMILDKT